MVGVNNRANVLQSNISRVETIAIHGESLDL